MQSSILAPLSEAAGNDLEDGEADVLLPFNPVRNWLTWTIPIWFWSAVSSIGPWRILGNFYARCCTGLVRGVLSTTSVIAPHCSAPEHAA